MVCRGNFRILIELPTTDPQNPLVQYRSHQPTGRIFVEELGATFETLENSSTAGFFSSLLESRQPGLSQPSLNSTDRVFGHYQIDSLTIVLNKRYATFLPDRA